MDKVGQDKMKNIFRRIIRLIPLKNGNRLNISLPVSLILILVFLFIFSLVFFGSFTPTNLESISKDQVKPSPINYSQPAPNSEFIESTSGFQMILNVTVQGNNFSGTLEENNGNIVNVVGQVGNLSSFNPTDQQRLNSVVQKYGPGTESFVVFTDPSTVQGGSIALDCTYCAVVDTNDVLQGIWFFPTSTSTGGDGTFKLTPEIKRTQTSTEFNSGTWKGYGTYGGTKFFYYDWKSEKVSTIGKYTAPKGYNYIVVTLYIKNAGDESIWTYPQYWNMKVNGIKYNFDLCSYSLNQGYVGVEKDGEVETKIAFLIKEKEDLSQAEIAYIITSIKMQRINHY